MGRPDDIIPVSIQELKQNPSLGGVPLVILIGAAVATAYVLSSTPLRSANDRSRWATVYSLVDEGTWHIDRIDAVSTWTTIDKVRHNGHFYSSKPPLLPAIVAGVYWCVQKTTAEMGLSEGDGWRLYDQTKGGKHTKEVTRTILIIVNVIPMVIAWLLINRMLVRYADGRYAKRLILIAAVFATPMTSFLPVLNNHVVAACAIVFALSPALAILVDDRRSPWLFILAGFFAAFACVNELPALSFLGLLGLFLLKRDPKRTLMFFAPAALIPIAASIGMTYWQTGGWKPFYFFYGTEKYEYVFEGRPSYWLHPRGFDKNADDFATYLLHCTFGHHGVFSLTPLFLLMIPAWIAPGLTKPAYRSLVWMTAILTLVVFGFYLGRPQNYNYGGNSSYLRWLIWLIPLWLMCLVPVLNRCGEQRWMQCIAGLFLGVGCFSTFWSIENPWSETWMFSLLDRWEQVDQYDDPEEPFERTHYAWFSSLPSPPADGAEGEWVELSGIDSLGRAVHMTLRDGGLTDGNRRTIQIEENLASPETVVHSVVLDQAKFDAGRKIESCLIEPDQSAGAEYDRILDLIRGMPSARSYNEGRARYLKTPVHPDALTCQLALSQVEARPPGARVSHIYRCESWYCDALPFGVAQVKFAVRPKTSTDRVSAVILRVSAASSVAMPDGD